MIDGNSLLYRAFFALPPLTNAKGEQTNAVYGFTAMLFKIIDEERPDMMAVAFDLPGPTFRHRRFPEYKATRPETPDELAAQIGMARQVLEAMQIPAYDYEGYEADDIIGTLAALAERSGQRVLVVTGDLDELQLVSDRVSVMVTRRGISDTKTYDVAAVEERYGFGPDKLTDFRALRGDTSDNIPGVPGIGEKTAGSLLKRFGSLEGALEHLDEIKPARIAAALEAHAELAKSAKELSAIVRDLPIRFDPEALRLRAPGELGPSQRDDLSALFRRLDFRSLVSRIEGPRQPVAADHRTVTRVRAAEELARELKAAKEVAIYPIAGEGSGLRAPLRGLCLLAEGRGEPSVILAEGARFARLLAHLKPILESGDIGKVGHDLKRLALLLSQRGIGLHGMSFDTMIASHLTNPVRRSHDLAEVVFEHLPSEGVPQMSLLEGDGGESSLDPSSAATAARQIAALKPVLKARLEEMELDHLFRELEMPLIPVLVDMERAGVAIDLPALDAFSDRLGARARELAREIHDLAGEEFNIGSPKQLREILFDKLGLPPDKTKRTKSGYSTDADVLSGLSEHEIVAKILEYRQVTKLKSTYVDALPPLSDPKTGRLHTSFNQAVTATGRLSSSGPNLQNIPIRRELGMEIRRAFIAGSPDHVLLSADYSQIELRILAHITEDENLIEIFLREEDLHRAAAAEIFGVDPTDVTLEMRSFAKMVNFGIPYGISDFRLAREMSIPLEDARSYMDRYFARFPRLHAYIEEMPKRARAAGFVTTLLGRRRPLPELRSRNPALRQAAERMAVNTPMQGSAADIMKLAMLRLHCALQTGELAARLLLQVHDELLLEVPRSQLNETARLVEEAMGSAYDLRVPLKVDTKSGSNWLDMEPLQGTGAPVGNPEGPGASPSKNT
ncbi:MAG: DNA polymerase I [Armatimonadota bacterium]|nr:MAG: DNA polymerase I [Armatimonadota bacterium]